MQFSQALGTISGKEECYIVVIGIVHKMSGAYSSSPAQ